MPPLLLCTLPLPADLLARLAQVQAVSAAQLAAPPPAPGSALASALEHAQVLLVGPTEAVDAALLARLPALRAVCSIAVGTNNIDVAACRARGITVTNAPGVLTETTADFGMALLLAAARRTSAAEAELRAGQWRGWEVGHFAGADVHGSRLGVVGLGRIGQAVARRAVHGFGMQVSYHNRQPLAPALAAPLGAQWRPLDDLLAEADHVLLTLPYSAAVHHLIGARELALMPPHATLVNLARGGVLDEAALALALHEGRIAGAALDVFEGEPAVHPALLAAPNCTLTPHIASASRATRHAMCAAAVANAEALLRGLPALTPVV